MARGSRMPRREVAAFVTHMRRGRHIYGAGRARFLCIWARRGPLGMTVSVIVYSAIISVVIVVASDLVLGSLRGRGIAPSTPVKGALILGGSVLAGFLFAAYSRIRATNGFDGRAHAGPDDETTLYERRSHSSPQRAQMHRPIPTSPRRRAKSRR
jgi:hypothetical protein